MSATNPDDLALSLQKATEVFTAIVDLPKDMDIIDIQQLLLPVLMKTNYDKLTLTHNLSGVILPTKHYEHIYSNKAYLIPPVIALYDNTIDKDVTRTEVHRAEGKMKPSKITTRPTKRPIRPARTLSRKSSTRLGTKSSRARIRSIAGGILGQYCCGGHEKCCKRRTTSGVSG